MRRSVFDLRGRTAPFLLLCIIAAILFGNSYPNQSSQPGRLHSRALQPEFNLTENHAQALLPRVPKAITQPASAEVYAKAARKGQVLMCWMRNPALASDQAISTATKFEQLEEWGWRSSGGPPVIGPNYLQEADTGLITLVGTAWANGNRVLITHTEGHTPVEEGGKTYKYPPTMGYYDNRFFHRQGVMIGDSNWSPTYKVETGQVEGWDKSTDRIPEVNRLSDIGWLIWAKLCADTNTDPSTLNYIAEKSVVNPDTQSVLASVIQKHWAGESEVDAGRVPVWPGKVITKDMDGFAALVGTPNIWGVAYLAVQRAGEVGKKQIRQITAWNGYPDAPIYQPNMIVELEAVQD